MTIISLESPGKRQPLTDDPGIVTEFDFDGSRETDLNQLQLVTIEIKVALELREFCQRNMVTLSNVFQVAWGLVLRCYSASDKVCFGYCTAKLDEMCYNEDTAGIMTCTIEFARNASLVKTLQQWSSMLLNGSTNLSVQQRFNTAIFQIFSDVEFGGTTVLDQDDRALLQEKDEIVVKIDVQKTRMAASLEYQASTLDSERAVNLLQAFVKAITEIATKPQGKVIELDLCSKQDINKILNWNRQVPEGSENCVHDLIRQQCLDHPSDLAVRSWDGNLTFGQVDQLSSNLAANLAELGIGPEAFVPLCFEKSKWAVIAIIGVIKAGGAYTFLDPHYPLERMRSICKDLQATVIVTSTKQRIIGEKLMNEVVVVGGTDMRWKKDSGLTVLVKPQNALYTVFTSGSTGKPKGVVMEHAAFCAKAKANGPRLSLTRNSRVLQFANYTYDISNRDILLTLIFGGCICIPPESDRMDNIVAFMNNYQINWASLTPSVANLLAPASVPDLQHLILGGEPMSTRNITSWGERVCLMNAYGPSECAAISSILSEIKPGSDHRNIGRGIGSVLWVVDPSNHEKLVPVGAVGELVIESASVGRGYIGDKEATNALFLSETSWLPQSRSSKSGRLYKTGDLVQYATNGSLRYVGRKDTQVKLRGHRIELGEVEHHVRKSFAGTREVVAEVVTPTGEDRPPMLVAFVCCESVGSELGREAGKDSLFAAPSDLFRSEIPIAESRLHEIVPAYMVPAVFIPLIAIPLTKAGKTDRRRLREQAAALSFIEREAYSGPKVEKRRPTTAAEKMLQQLWSRVLNMPPETIGADDSFFRLGGDSITAMKLTGVGRLEGLALSVADVFKHPKLSDLSHTIHGMSENGAETIMPFSLLGHGDTRDSIIRVAMEQCQLEQNQIEDIYPCTALQEGLMALTARKAGAYTARFSYRLPAGLDPDQFRAAWNAVADKNVILRTRVIQTDDLRVFQVVVRGNPCWAEHANQDTYNPQVSKIPMGLGNPLIHAGIVRGEDEAMGFRFILTLHHALYDGWSLPLLLEQVEAAYRGQLLLPQLFSPFIAYLSQSKEAAEEFWRSEFVNLDAVSFPQLLLAGYTPVPEMSLKHVIALPQRTTDDFTFSTKLRLAWAIVLSQYTGTDDVVFGLTVTGRGAPVVGIEKMTGPTIATIPFRVLLEQDKTVAEALRKMQDHLTSMIPYEQTGLQNINRLGVEAAAACQFQNLLVIQPPHREESIPSMFSVCDTDYDQGAFTTYALTLQCELSSDSIAVSITFDGQVIGEEDVRRLLHQFTHILRQINDRPTIPVRDITRLNPEDQRQLIQWNEDVPERVNRCVHDLIYERCLVQPDAPAVCAWDGNLTYGELDRLSSALAVHLASLGVGPEVFVPLCFEKSRWTTVAMVGVMKAGGAFVLLDPSHPVARLEGICHDMSATLIVASVENTAMSTSLATEVVTVGDHHTAWQNNSDQWAASSVTPENAVYAVFTSGSTGKPKGAVIEHLAFCSSAIPHSKALFLNRKSRVFQFSSYAFDVSVTDNLTTLLVGGCVCVPSESDRKNRLVLSVSGLRATSSFFTPSIARTLQPKDFPTLETVVLGGEMIVPADVRLWAEDVHVINQYGPAECSVITTIQPRVSHHSNPNNIGFATGAVCWIVDRHDHNKLVPIGAVGELLIEGPIVGRGYLNDLRKTAVAFIENPAWLRRFREENGGASAGRLYKTGDLVQYAADGSLRFVGRKDTQVKLRGQRIELGEVEHHVRQSFPGARDVVAEVITPTGEDRPPMLVAFIYCESVSRELGLEASRDGLFAAPSDLFQSKIPVAESWLYETVPAYMVPAVFIPLIAVPLTKTGKTDRRRLREQAAALSLEEREAYSGPKVEKRRPSTAIEKMLQQLWSQVLNISPDIIGADDSFFRLGGDSITAMRLAGMSRLKGLVLSVADVFKHPKLSDLSHAIHGTLENGVETIVPFSLLGDDETRDSIMRVAMEQCQVEQNQIEDIYPCTALQEGLMALTARKTGAYTARFSYQLPAGLDPNQFHAAWNMVADMNIILRTRIIQTDDLQIFQVVVRNNLCWAEYANQDACNHQVSKIPMSLGNPLIHMGIVKGENEAMGDWFVLTLHHALYDGWSLPLLLMQVEAAYYGQLLPPQPFSPFIAYLSQSKEAAEEYWRSEFANLNTVSFPRLPFAGYVPAPDMSLKHVIALPQKTTDDFTFSTKLRLAWAIALSQYTDTDDVVFGLTVTGRGAPVVGIEKMTGPTIATIPFRVLLEQDNTLAETLRKMQDHSTSMIPYEQTGLQNINRLGAEAALACQFQNLLVIQPYLEKSVPSMFSACNTGSDQGAFTTYALTLYCELSSDSITVHTTFDGQVIGEEDVRRLLHQFAHMLRQINDGPAIPVRDITGLNPEDQRQLIQWNRDVPERVNCCVHDLIQERCLAQPDASAVCAWDGNLTYGELDRLSSALAVHLASFGVGPEVFVPLCFEKSRWTTVAMVGVMKAGGAFVLLDPSHPVVRLEGICRDVSATVMVASVENTAMGTSLAKKVVTVGDYHTAWCDNSGQWAPSSVTPENAVYAVFTSGSTGTPKGVVIEHAAFCSSSIPHINTLCLSTKSRVFQFASYSFDASVTDNLTTLLAGSCICVPSDIDRKNYLTRSANQLQVNWADLTPSIARILQPKDIPTLKTLVLGGERVTKANVKTWASEVNLIISYGPTECSAKSSGKADIVSESDPRNIGRGTGSLCWIVDRHNHNKLVPIGAVGELLIEGPIVGRGYLNDSRKTAAAFIESPRWLRRFREENGGASAGRLYKTGDLVQYAPDGSIHYIGRKDMQVKLRGQRIELGEVEHHVRQSFPGARDVVAEVVTPTGEDRPPMLVAFVCCESIGSELVLEADRDSLFAAPSDSFRSEIPVAESRLHEIVPAYMVPAVFIQLIAIPLTKAGKTDRRRLYEQAAALSLEGREAYSGPKVEKRRLSTAVEKMLQQLWSRVLDISPDIIGADDSFFRLGGDSITAMRLTGIARLEGLVLSVVDVFTHPKLSDLSHAICRESEKSAETIMPFSLLGDGNTRDSIIRVAMEQCQLEQNQIEDIYPCTALQEGLMALTARKTGAYTARFSYRLSAGLDLNQFRAAWNAVAGTNAILRTRIIQTDDLQIFQVVVHGNLCWAEYANQDTYSPQVSKTLMGLGNPLIHAGIVRGKDEATGFQFILTLHHALYDGWSLPILLGQVEAAYHGQLLLPQLFSPFIAYLYQSKKAADSEKFWGSEFANLNAVSFPQLPSAGYAPVPDMSLNHVIALPRKTTDDFTFSTKLRLAWAIVLSQYTDTDDVVFGVTVTGRGAPVVGIEKMTGPTIATIPFRVWLERDETVAEALRKIQDHSTSMIPYEQTGLQNINRLGAEAASACQFQNLLIIQPYREKSIPSMFSACDMGSDQGAFTTYALTLQCKLSSGSMIVHTTFDGQVIGEEDVRRLLHQFAHMLRQINDGPTKPIRDITALNPEDQRKLIRWNGDVPERVNRCVHDLIQERCLAQPEAPAVCAWDGNLTYGELDRLSSALAVHLTSLGVGPEVFVPLCFEKSRWTTVAIVGVMKAGGAFVLLDPSHPVARLEGICREVSATVIVTSVENTAMGASLATMVVTVGDYQMAWSDNSGRWAASSVTPEDAVYAVFTSGSTGIPKGVVIEHASYSTGTKAHSKAWFLGPQSRVFQFAAYSFDPSVGETLTTLLVGGCLCVPSEADRRNNIVEAAHELGATWADLTPSILRSLKPGDFPLLKTLLVAGEPMGRGDVALWAQHVRLINSYGPAECSVVSNVQYSIKLTTDPANIGYGTGSVSWIVDRHDHNKLVPIGAVGELLIEGPIVGRGYLNDPQKTAAAFIESPPWLRRFREENGGASAGRLYKTGDLVQYAADGSLRFVGRKDTQVKLRGQRIELGEVEYHVRRSFPGAYDVVAEVVTPTGEDRPPMLVAFIVRCESVSSELGLEVGRDGLFMAPSDLFRSEIPVAESRLQETVPAYMVPAVFIPLTAVPLTKTGKTDRRRLREQAAALSLEERAAYSGPKVEKRRPSTAAEKMLQRLWSQILNISPDTIGADDSFFRLGGDSITAMRLTGMSRLEGLALSVADVFKHPKLSDLSHAIRGMSENGAETVIPFSLLGDGDTQDSIIRVAMEQCQLEQNKIEDIYPCTALQEGLMALTARKAGAYMARFSYRLSAGLDLNQFQAAWNAVAHTNVILRTRIIQTNDLQIFQVVVRGNLCWAEYANQDECNLQVSKMPMGLGSPLIYMGVVEGEDEAMGGWFTLTLHHALYDGWSLPLLLMQVEAAYHGQLLPPQPFSPFIAYLSQSKEAAEEYWRSEFANLNAVSFPQLPLAGYAPVPEMSLKHVIALPQKATDDFTFSTKLRLAWGIVLSQYTDTDDVVFGLTVTGRGAPVVGIENMTGPTIATIPFRVLLEQDKTVAEALRKIQDHSTSMIPYEQTGLQNINRLGVEAASACQFQNLLIIQPYREESMLSIFSACDAASNQGAFTTYALTLHCELSSDSITVHTTFDGQVIEEEDVRRLLHQFAYMLRQINDGPTITVRDITALNPEDQRKLIQWNGDVPERVNRCVHDLIQERCLAQPDAPAVCAWDGNLTYGELDRLSSALAVHLASLGVGPEVFVPLCFEKSRWTTVAIVGVMKAGGAFVLLDPSHPVARLEGICRNVSATLIVTSVENTAIGTTLAKKVVTVGDYHMAWSDNSGQWAASSVTPENAIYAVFTSGSTGKPKGAVIEHLAFCSSAIPHSKALFLNRKSRVFQFSSYAFDVSVTDNLTTLLVGGCVCVPSESDRKNRLALSVSGLQATLSFFTPSIARTLQPKDFPTMETVVLVGEPMVPADVRLWAKNVHLINHYGPAECSVITTIQSKVSHHSNPNNIGFATGAVCWIVDRHDHNKLVPIGAVGELLIEGPIVGRGYLNDPQKTAAAFIESPPWLRRFREENGGASAGRLYKTGDLVQYAVDGSLCFVGRRDTQVKLRGHRIELGEVEHHLRQNFPGTRDVVAEVVTPTGEDRPPMLVAFICCESVSSELGLGAGRDGLFAPPSDLFRSQIPVAESRLQETVPAYMVPAVFIPLTTIPLTKTGKTDRRRLREQAAALSLEERAAYSGPKVEKRRPSTAAEKMLQHLWSRILNISPDVIGADDSFFRLGGDSITAMRLTGIARLEGLSLSVADVFKHPKLSDLSHAIRGTPEDSAETVIPFSLLGDGDTQDSIIRVAMEQCQLEQNKIEDIYPCTALQEGLMALTARKAGAYTARFSYRLSAGLDPNKFQAAWNAVADTNAILRTRIIQTGDSQIFQVVVRGNLCWAEYANQDAWNLQVSKMPMGLGNPLIHMGIMKGENKAIGFRFFLTLHHALYDGWSLPLLLMQVEAAYHGQFLSPQPFSPFIAYLSRSKKAAEEYWRSEFANLNAVSFPQLLLTGYVPVPDMSLKHVIALPQKATDDFTFSTKLRLAWGIVLSQYTDTDDVVFGLTVTGRGAPVVGIEKMTGPTIATFPFRVLLEQDKTVAEALRKIQDHSTSMIPYEQTGLQNINRLGVEAASACQFQTLLIIQPHQEERVLSMFSDCDTISDQGAFTTYTLTLHCELSSDSMTVHTMFDGQVIEEEDVRRLLHQFAYMLRQINDRPTIPVRDIAGLNPEDQRQLIQWNGDVPERVNRCVHDLIQERCLAQPDASAVCAWDGNLTYGELDRLSSALAVHLASLGVGPEVFVPLCFEKSRWTTVAMVGVMKAGGAFVLLDPSHPVTRLEGICRDVSATLIVTSVENIAMGTSLATKVVTVGDYHTAWSDNSGQWAASSVTPESAVYAVFTSGSTGTPKGVVIEHASFNTGAMAHSERFCLTSTSRVFQFSSYAFDASIIENLTTLLVGGCICVPSDATRQNNTSGIASELQVTWAQFTPSFTRSLRLQDIPTLDTLVLVGEVMTANDVSSCVQSIQLMNAYGPAECSVASNINTNIMTASHPRDIGQGVGSVSWIVDRHDHNKPVPIGVVGELLIEGPIVGRGYLSDPQKTAAAFIESPPWLRRFRKENGGASAGRLYKTGDLVHYTVDGSLRYVGRKDTQVKLRGQRIELAEVEYHIRRSFPGARNVVAEVVTPTEEDRPPMLVAFICCESIGSEPGLEAGRDGLFAPPSDSFRSEIPVAESRLHEIVPAYMVPAVFIPLIAIPLTKTGKTDRRRLREQAAALSLEERGAYSGPKVEKRRPSTAAEQRLQQLWARVLHVPPGSIGVYDSFFSLGGDSITAMKLASLARQEELELSMVDVFSHPKLADLAAAVAQIPYHYVPQAEPAPFSLLGTVDLQLILRQNKAPGILIEADDIIDALPTTQFQHDYIINDKQCTYFLLYIPGNIDHGRLHKACRSIVKQHAILRTVFIQYKDDIVQVVLRQIDTQISKLTSHQDLIAFSKSLCREDSVTPVPLGVPPFRLTLVSQGVSQHALIIRLSHAQYDGFSVPQLYTDLAAAYHGNRLSAATDFSFHIQHRLWQKSTAAYQFWREYLQGCSMTFLNYCALGGDLSAVATSINATKEISLPIPPSGVTMATVVKAAWSFVLVQLTKQRDLVFGHVVNGRSLQKAENISGPCVNIIPVRVTLQPTWTAWDLLNHVQSQNMRSMSFETSDLRDIVKHSTQWPTDTRFGSIVQHQNIEINPQISLDGIECTSTTVTFLPVAKDFLVGSIPRGDRLEIQLSASSKMVNLASANDILEQVCAAVSKFSLDPSNPLFIPGGQYES